MRRPGYLGNCDVMRPRQLNGFGYTPFGITSQQLAIIGKCPNPSAPCLEPRTGRNLWGLLRHFTPAQKAVIGRCPSLASPCWFNTSSGKIDLWKKARGIRVTAPTPRPAPAPIPPPAATPTPAPTPTPEAPAPIVSAPKTTITEPPATPAITQTPAETVSSIQQIMNKSQSGQPLTAQETILLRQLQLQQQQFATGAALATQVARTPGPSPVVAKAPVVARPKLPALPKIGLKTKLALGALAALLLT